MESKWNLLCLAWLVRNDPEGRALWLGLPRCSDFVGAVRDNLRDFGPDESGQAEWVLHVL